MKYCPLCKTPFPDNYEECNICNSKLIMENEFLKKQQDYEKNKLNDYKKKIQEEYRKVGKILSDEEFEQGLKNAKLENKIRQCAKSQPFEEPQQNIPKCPICQSTNLKKISGANKVASVGLFGIFSVGHINKTWKCNNCGSKF